MTKQVYFLVVTVFLGGCGVDVTPAHLETAEDVCANRDGLQYLCINTRTLTITAVCVDEHRFTWDLDQ